MHALPTTAPLPALPPTTAFGPSSTALPDYGVELVRMLGVIGLYLAALALLVWLLPKLLRGRGTRAARRSSGLLEHVDSIQLEPGKRIHVVRVAGAFYLVGAGSDGALRKLTDGPLDAVAVRHALAERATPSPATQRSAWRTFAQTLGSRPIREPNDNGGLVGETK